MIKILYFARLREALGTDQESVGAELGDVAGVLAHLRARGGAWAAELAPQRNFRVAVNQEMASADTPVQAGDEVALFPPVTGG